MVDIINYMSSIRKQIAERYEGTDMTTQSLTTRQEVVTPKRPLIQKVAVVVAIMTTIGGTLTGIMTLVNVGFTESFVNDWLSSFGFAILVMMPSGFALMTIVNKLVDTIVPSATKTQRNIIVGVTMAIVMESIMSAVTTANNIGFADSSVFIDAWIRGFAVALPVGLVMSVVMSLTLKPKLEQFMAS